jgi:Flp pilus assembly pilin Flp
MLNNIRTFAADESGAVTVDWVVLTAALVGLGLAVMGVISGGISSLTGNINTAFGTAGSSILNGGSFIPEAEEE